MAHRIPPKRRAGRIRLDSAQHERLLRNVRAEGGENLVNALVTATGLYLRGRSTDSGAPLCGYLFLNEKSFTLGHAPVGFIDLAIPTNTLVFRKWNGVLPFPSARWNSLAPDRMMPKTMRAQPLASKKDIEVAVELCKVASATFSAEFDLSADLSALNV